MPDARVSGSPFAKLARHALLFGGIAGVLAGLWTVSEHVFGLHTARADIGRYTSLAVIIFPVAAMVIGLSRWRDQQYGGTIRFAQAFGAALAIGMAFALMVGAMAWLHAKLDPQLISGLLEAQAAALRSAGTAPEKVEAWLANARQYATPGVYGYQLFLRALVQAFLVALLASVALRKKPLPAA